MGELFMRLRVPRATVTALPAAALLALCLLPAGAEAVDSTRCAENVDDHLASLPLAQDDVRQIRIIERVNIADFGPEIFGVDAWVRLNSCSGWVVVNMTPACFVRQTYTRGDCRVDGVTHY
jgi:hypothetical protein